MLNDGHSPVQRYAPLACWLIVIAAALLLCLKILGYGYLPGGDARRHAAHVFTDRDYTQIVVMKPLYSMNHSPGWEWLLRQLQRLTHWNEDGLIAFSIAVPLGFILCVPLFWMRRPEAWLAALLAQLIAIPELMTRLTQGRPYLLTEGVLICLLLAWSKEEAETPPWPKILLSGAAFALSAWMHGAWYLWALLPPAFFLAQRWRAGAWLGACWLGGSFLGGCLTGRPFVFLKQAVMIAVTIQQEHAPARLLVGEFRPSEGEFATLAILAAVYLWSKAQKIKAPPLARQPVFWMILVPWVLGFFADRFWADWGLPAALVWMAMQFDEAMPLLCAEAAPARLAACALIALPLYLDATNDLDQRYTNSLHEPFVDGSQPGLQGWMPDPGGIFYSAQMRFFYNTFYRNPQGDWRYIIGYEPALMPDDDLKILRNIQLSGFAPESFEPWAAKLRPQDRLEIESPNRPDLPALEWKNAVSYIWIGRLPRATPSPKEKP